MNPFADVAGSAFLWELDYLFRFGIVVLIAAWIWLVVSSIRLIARRAWRGCQSSTPR